MKANELMIGDWVTFADLEKDEAIIPIQIGSIEFGSVWAFIDHDKGADELDFEGIAPIHLMPEILEKNGWVKFQMYYRLRIDDTQYLEWYPHEGRLQRLYIHKDNSREVVFTVSGLSYTHELQHALRLCGIDKEIVL